MTFIRKYFFLVFLLFCSVAESQTLNVPARAPSAMTGDQFVAYITSMSLTDRENAIYDEVLSGNVPNFMRNLVPVNSSAVISSITYTATYYVIPDYLAIGCDTNYFLCPMTPLLAQRIADQIGCTLPSRKMVDNIWAAATVHLSPSTISPSPQMTTVPVFATHDSTVWVQRSAVLATHPLGELVGGDKKDVILSNHIYGNPSPGRVVIYGWHYTNGTPIQPLYYGHEETYADYSHGIRMVQQACTLNGVAANVDSILASSTYNTVLSDEGAIAIPRYPVAMPQPVVPKSFCILNEGVSEARILLSYDLNNSGYIIQKSTDGLNFTDQVSTTDTDIVITGLPNDCITYFRIASYNSIDTSSYSEVLAVTPSIFNERVLIVNGFDRTSAGNTFDFIRQHGSSIFTSGYLFSSATNDAITNGLINLNDYAIIDWILGDESTVDESFSDNEQIMVSEYLDGGGKLFTSGSEIAWDLDFKGSASDKNFYHHYLKAEYVNDAPNGQSATYYSAAAVASQFFSSLVNFSFDNGTHGTFNVKYPDVIDSTGGSANCFYYSGLPTNFAGVCFTGNFPGGSVNGKIVNIGIPFETVYPDSSENNFMSKILEYFEPSPTAFVTVSGPTTFCEGDSIVLTALQDHGYSYQWIKDGNDLSGDTLPMLTVFQNGTYAVIITHNGITATSSDIPVTINPKPTAVISTSDPTGFCLGGYAVLTASSGSGYSYQWMLEGSAISGATDQDYISSLQGNYYIEITANSCSAISDSIAITTWPLPDAFAGNDTAVCSGSYITLNATGGCNYQWDQSVSQNIPFIPSSTATYVVTVTNVMGCSSTDDITVVVNPLPPTPVITQNNNYLLSSPAYTYQWYNSTGILLNDTNQLLVPQNDDWYYVIVTDSNGCSSQSVSFLFLTAGIDLSTFTSYTFNVFENNLAIEIPFQGTTTITLISPEGKEAAYFSANHCGQYSFDLSELSQGIYFLKVENCHIFQVYKINIR
jgi:hypothetical protein